MRALAPRELTYLGLIGSRAKVARITAALLAEGVPAATLQRVHAPVGLEIGAVTPAEIAISILAELIAVRRGANVDRLSMKDVKVPAPRDKDRVAVDADS
jgi:xanthine dehydrogenase accessory factor